MTKSSTFRLRTKQGGLVNYTVQQNTMFPITTGKIAQIMKAELKIKEFERKVSD